MNLFRIVLIVPSDYVSLNLPAVRAFAVPPSSGTQREMRELIKSDLGIPTHVSVDFLRSTLTPESGLSAALADLMDLADVTTVQALELIAVRAPDSRSGESATDGAPA